MCCRREANCWSDTFGRPVAPSFPEEFQQSPMSKIAVIHAGAAPSADVVMFLHKTLGLGVSGIQRAAQSGSPLGVLPLFGNDHDERAATLRVLLSDQDLAASLRWFELDDDGEFVSVADAAIHEVDASTVSTILDGFDVEVARQHRWADRES